MENKVVAIFFGLLFSFSAQAQFQAQLNKKFCSGSIADLNCYEDIIKKQAREMNRKEEERAYRHAVINNSYAPLKRYYQGRQIMIDIADQQSCMEIRAELREMNLHNAQKIDSLENLCDTDPESPFETVKTITIMGEVDEQYVRSYTTKYFTSTESTLLNETRNLVGMMAGTMGFLYTLPNSVTKWTSKESKWQENVTRPPVWDKDDWAINYIGHPVSGAYYYTVARNLGYSKTQAFGYTVVMSTFFWEYGFEAMAERPSIQDLIVTPLLGALLGEQFYQWEQKILANGGRVNGSKTLGRIMLFILNPVQRISEMINNVLGSKVIQNSKFEVVTSRRRINPLFPDSPRANYIGIQIRFTGNFL